MHEFRPAQRPEVQRLADQLQVPHHDRKCPKWVGPYNRDTNFSDDGDHEERNSTTWNTAKAACGNKDPIAMRADALYAGSVVLTLNCAQLTGWRSSHPAAWCAGTPTREPARAARATPCATAVAGRAAKRSWRESRTRGPARRLSVIATSRPPTTWMAQRLARRPTTSSIRARTGSSNTCRGGNVRLVDVWSGKYLTASSNTDQAAVLVKNFGFSAAAAAVDHRRRSPAAARCASGTWAAATLSDGGQLHRRSVLTRRYFRRRSIRTGPARRWIVQ